MALIIDGTTVENVLYKSSPTATPLQLDKLVFEGVTVWENWKYKSGNLVKMTSNTSPTPYTSDHYQVFGGGRLAGTEKFAQTIQTTLNFNTAQIKIKQLYVEFVKNSGPGYDWTFENTVIVYFKDGTSEILRNSAAGTFSGYLDISEANQHKEVKSVYLKYQRTGGSGGIDQPVIRNAKITEWYQKGA